MPTLYVAKRRDISQAKSRAPFLHHFAWSVVCLILLVVILSLWSYAQTLQAKNSELNGRLAAVQTGAKTCKVTGEWTAGSSTNHTVMTADGERKYLLHLPSDFKDSSYYPIVMFYPGKGGQVEDVHAAFGLNTLPAITVYPYPTIGRDGVTAWEGAPYSSGADDVAFTASVLDKIQSELCIDRTRVYAIGLSNGGAFASLLSCKLPERFAAYAVIAGAMYDPDGSCRPSSPSPLLNVHGDNDPIVPYDGSIIRRLPQIDEWVAKRAEAERCQRPVTTYPDSTQIITTWEKCRNNGVVQNVRVIGGVHAWGQLSNETLWQFLSRFTL